MDTTLHRMRQRAVESPDSIAVMVKRKGAYRPLTWRQFWKRVECLAHALADHGVSPGDRVGIQSWTRLEWTVADLAASCLGAVVVPIYPQLTARDCRYILGHAGVSLLFCEDREQCEKIAGIEGELEALSQLVVFDDDPDVPESVLRFEPLWRGGRERRKDRPEWMDERLVAIEPDDVLTIVYTSGTTGPPKGVVLTHRGFEFNAAALEELARVVAGERFIAYLPLAHVYERFAQFTVLSRGVIYCYAESIEKLGDNLREIKPHIMPGVPRVYEKAYAGVMRKIEASNPLRRGLGRWALRVGRRVFERSQRSESIPAWLGVQHRLAERLVFAKIRLALGGALRIAVVAAAPVSPELCAFFNSLGVPLLEGWGMSETTAPVTINPPEAIRLGTAGPPFPGMDLRIAYDGEVQVRGPSVLKEYYRDPEATAESFTADGFFKTGDLGELDSHGYLKIIGRKKDILITAYGKNIAARNIEDHYATEPLFGGCVVYGDGKKYLTAVLSLSEEAVAQWAESQGRSGDSYESLVKSEALRERVDEKLAELNQGLAHYEEVKRYVLAERPFSVETGELTPTLKVKRREVIRRYQERLDSLY